MQSTCFSIGKRLVLGFGVVLLIAVAIGVTGYYSASRISEGAISAFRVMLSTEMTVLEHSLRARSDVVGLRRAEKDVFLNIDSQETVEKYMQVWKQERDDLYARLNDIEKAATEDKQRNAVRTMKAEGANYEAGFEKVAGMIRNGKIKTPQEANTALSEYKEAIHQFEQGAKDLSADSSKKVAETEKEIRDIADRAKFTAMCLMIAAIAIGVVICALAIRSIIAPLKKIIDGISEGAEQVANASNQISTTSQQLAEGASEQAAAIEETSSSLEEMSSMTKQNASNANQANQLMTVTRESVSQAGKSMGHLTTSMGEISKASEDTSKIIKTIDEIAFQTNLLALNAAVEAARAGEAGAGFAVVADEVRNLALRAADAAKNTADLIEATVKKVHEGSELVGETEQEFREVAASVGKSAELVGEITAASAEQSHGIEQVNRAVSDMDKVVQQNASNAEESASASEEMNAQANNLKEFVSGMKSLVYGSSGNGAAAVRGMPATADRKSPAPALFSKRPGSRKGGGALPLKPQGVIPFDDDAGPADF